MKILQVNVVYKKGSTGKIVYDLHKCLLDKGIESVVCYGRGQKESETGVYKTSTEFIAKLNNLRSRVTGLQYNGAFLATNKLIRIIKNENPDIVHLHCLNGFFVNIYRLLKFLKIKRIKTVLTLHAEFMYTGSCGYAYDCEKWSNQDSCGYCPQLREATKSWFLDRTHTAWVKMKKAFEGFDDIIIIGVSQWIINRAKASPIMKGKNFKLLYNGIETTDIFYDRYDMAKQLRQKHNIQKNEKIILYVTPDFENEIKGGKYFLELANRMKNENCKFIIVGFNNSTISMPSNIIALSRTNDQKELAAYYSLADLFVITSLCDNYPTVCLEAVSCGTPIIGFDVGGIKETIPKGFGNTVKQKDINTLKSEVIKWMNKKSQIEKDQIDKYRIFNSKERMMEQYLEIYRILLKQI